MLEISGHVLELEKVRQELDRARVRLERLKDPWRTYSPIRFCTLLYRSSCSLLRMSRSRSSLTSSRSFFLCLASVISPVPFGFLAFVVSRLGLRGAFALGISAATIAVALMLVITGVNDAVPIIPASRGEWRDNAARRDLRDGNVLPGFPLWRSSALTMVSLVPAVVLGILVQRHLVRGLTLGAVQG